MFEERHTCARRSGDSTRQGAQAFARLPRLAETRDFGQFLRIARFIAAACNGQALAFDLFDLRAVHVATGDGMRRCPDALCWERADLHTLVPDGEPTVRDVLDRWGLRPSAPA